MPPANFEHFEGISPAVIPPSRKSSGDVSLDLSSLSVSTCDLPGGQQHGRKIHTESESQETSYEITVIIDMGSFPFIFKTNDLKVLYYIDTQVPKRAQP